MATSVELPEGFTLDPPPKSALPEGFVLDQPGGSSTPESQRERSERIQADVLDVAGEAAAGANRGLLYLPDLAVRGLEALGQLATGSNLHEAVDTIKDPDRGLTGAVGRVTGHRPGEGNFMEADGPNILGMGTPRQAVQAAGEVLLAGAPALHQVPARNLAKSADAAAEFLGFGSATGAPARVSGQQIAEQLGDVPTQGIPSTIDDATRAVAEPQVSPKLSRELALKRRTGDVDTAGFKLDDAGRVVPDPLQQQALRVGLDEGIVAQVSNSSDRDKGQISKMLEVVRKGMKNKTYADHNLPRQVLGDSLYQRFQAVRAANKNAGARVGAIVKRLGGSRLNADAFADGPVASFKAALEEAGVTFSANNTPDFSRSRFRGSPAARKAIMKTVKELKESTPNTLADVHSLKIFIDDMIDEAGRSNKAPSKAAQNIILGLRKDSNDFIRQYGPTEYSEANDLFSETIDLLDTAGDLIGRKNNPSPEGLARAARSALSNAQKSERTMSFIEDLERVSTNLGIDFGDDLKTQLSVVQTIEKLFPSAKPPASFGGEISKALDAGRRVATQGSGQTAADVAVGLGKKVFGKSDAERQAELLKVMQELTGSAQR